MLKKLIIVLAGVVSACAICVAADKSKNASPDFNRDVRPILSNNCFKCHGPDDTHREASLRLDKREAAIAKTESGTFPIVPGKAEESDIVHRIFSNDNDELMPPPDSNKKLSEDQKTILRNWIAAGAKYDSHWAFIAPKQTEPPAVKDKAWLKNPIDNFILARMETEGLSPSPAADRYTLVRRVYLDLIGIPPTPEEADAFVNDTSTDGYERLVDRLLESPHYGERWARVWLDLARYADTNGYTEDEERSIWPYRDWVINALNKDMPFDQFTIEQIAGDMLPNATTEQRIATGFHRNTLFNEEGGIDPLEYRFYSIIDRVNTTATTWIGLTLGCAQCHTHKYDPIPQRDYYHFFALMNNTEDIELPVPDEKQKATRAKLEEQIASLEKGLAEKFPLPKSAEQDEPGTSDPGPEKNLRQKHLDQKFTKWREDAAVNAMHWTTLKPKSAVSTMPILSVLDDNSVLAAGDQTNRDVYTLEYSTKMKDITGIRLEAIPDVRLPRGGPGRVFYYNPYGDFFLSEFTLQASGQPVKFKRAMANYMETNNRKGTINAKTAGVAMIIDGKPDTGWSVADRVGLPSSRAYLELSEPLKDVSDLKIEMLFEISFAAGLGRFRISVTNDPPPEHFNQLPTEIDELLTNDYEKLTSEQQQKLLSYYLSVAPELTEQNKGIAALRAQLPTYSHTLVLTERPAEHTRITYLHRRGEFLQTADKVDPDALSILPPLPAGALKNRLTMARWLVSPDNPLTARVTMNRQWAALFGKGIVRSVDDFGYQGDPPTHPELLDWLAVEFMNRGWSLKQMHRLMVTSAAYQQSSKYRADLSEKDPLNKLLARAPRYRLQAEQIRDATLRASGQLSSKIGGPSVFPPQPSGAMTGDAYHKFDWKESQGEDRYRRGLYTFTKRLSPFAMFNAFDAPNGTTCVAKRNISNSPLQALTLLNDPVFVEAAQSLGREMAKHDGSVNDRIAILFRRCLTRPPDKDEVESVALFYETQLARLENGQLSAKKLLGTRKDKNDGKISADDRNRIAAWATVARAILNLDEAITKE